MSSRERAPGWEFGIDYDDQQIAKEERTLWVVTYNLDYEEWARTFRTRKEALDDIASEFGLETDAAPDSEAWWAEIIEAYESDNWKGSALYKLDPETLETIKER
jgi:hypothetical protein